mmetsp:Transcript_52974/g.59234  ORF Transcript_52974/g.59234 Transcript_52974/m.59234 type:complete len:85 (-) Transcript_52974:291-545(-)
MVLCAAYFEPTLTIQYTTTTVLFSSFLKVSQHSRDDIVIQLNCTIGNTREGIPISHSQNYYQHFLLLLHSHSLLSVVIMVPNSN